ncbi:unnamed protein product, partial [Cuscuta epithymum]
MHTPSSISSMSLINSNSEKDNSASWRVQKRGGAWHGPLPTQHQPNHLVGTVVLFTTASNLAIWVARNNTRLGPGSGHLAWEPARYCLGPAWETGYRFRVM